MTGSGTLVDPYIIQNVTDLQAIEDDLAAYYELEGDIDASATSGWNGGEGFVPIGRGGTAFSGQLDGRGFTISDLTINMPSDANIGLFGILDNGAVVRNISMTGVGVTGSDNVGALFGVAGNGAVVDIDDCNSAGSVSITGSNNSYLGGLIGSIWDGTVDDCWSSCIVDCAATNSGTIVGGLAGRNVDAAFTNCHTTGSVTSGGGEVGGLIGRQDDGSCSTCYANGNVVSGDSYVGGLIGRIRNAPTLDDCYARGNATADPTSGVYVGGLIGRNGSGTIDDCYSTGTAAASGDIGGLIGENFGTVTNCFWDTEASGNASSDGGTGKTTAQMKTKSTFTGAGWNFTTIWYMDGYPVLSGGAIVFPREAITRVTNLIHRYNRKEGVYTLELALGEVTSDFGLPEWLSRPQASTPEGEVKKQAEAVAKSPAVKESVEKAVSEVLKPTGGATPTVSPAKDIFEFAETVISGAAGIEERKPELSIRAQLLIAKIKGGLSREETELSSSRVRIVARMQEIQNEMAGGLPAGERLRLETERNALHQRLRNM